MRLAKQRQTRTNQAPEGHKINWCYSFHEVNNTFNLLEQYKKELLHVLENPNSSEYRKQKAINRVQRTAKAFLLIELDY